MGVIWEAFAGNQAGQVHPSPSLLALPCIKLLTIAGMPGSGQASPESGEGGTRGHRLRRIGCGKPHSASGTSAVSLRVRRRLTGAAASSAAASTGAGAGAGRRRKDGASQRPASSAAAAAGAGAGAFWGLAPSADTLIEKIGENGPGSFDILICLQKG